MTYNEKKRFCIHTDISERSTRLEQYIVAPYEFDAVSESVEQAEFQEIREDYVDLEIPSSTHLMLHFNTNGESLF